MSQVPVVDEPTEVMELEATLADVMSQADCAVFNYRAECGRRGDGQWAEQLSKALEDILAVARRRDPYSVRGAPPTP